MSVIYSYPNNANILATDIIIGSSTKIVNGKKKNVTKNFEVGKIAEFYNEISAIAIAGQNNFFFQNNIAPGRKQGSITFVSGGGTGTSFGSITTLRISKFATSGNSVANYLTTLVDQAAIIAQCDNLNNFGIYKVISITTVVDNPNFVDVLIQSVNANGSILADKFYTFAVYPGFVNPNIDPVGVYDFISPLVDTDNVVTVNQSSTITDGYLSATDWNTFNNKQGSITLTTTGTSGNATFIGNVLNVPDYGSGFTTPTLNSVLTEGNTSLLNAYIGTELGLYDGGLSGYSTVRANEGTFLFVDANGSSILFAEPRNLTIFESPSIGATLRTSLLSASRLYQLPNASGTIALTSDPAPTLDQVLSAGNISTLPASIGTLSIWDDFEHAYMSMQSSQNYFYATSALGDSLFYFGDGSFFLNKTNFIEARISTDNLTASQTFDLPDQSGTIALLSDIPTSSGIPHTTASGTDTYTATVAGITSYADGDAYLVRFTNGNTTGCTLNINSLGAIPLYENNDGALIGGDIWAGAEMLCVYNSGSNVFQCIGTSSNSLFSYVTNADTVPITKGMPVYAAGGTGDRLTVKRAFNTSDLTSAQTVGVVLTSSIGVNQKGIIIIQGLLDGLSILPTSTWSDGDPIYLGATAGSITNVKQYAPNHLVYLGYVTTASNGSAGRWYVRVQNGYELDELHNVQAQSPTVNDILYYFGGSPGQWKTASIPAVLGYTPFQLPSLTSGSVIFSNGTTLVQDNSNFFWDDTNNRLGIGMAAPNERLHVKGNVQIGEGTGILEKIWCSGGNLISYDPGIGNLSIGNGRIVTNAVTQMTTIADSLTVNGDIQLGTGTSAIERLVCAAGGTMISFDPSPATFGIAGSTILSNLSTQVVSTSFAVGIGTTAPSTELEVDGVITATGGNSTSWNAKQDAITLTTTGTSGPATLVGATLNIPEYAGGAGGLQGVNNLLGYFPGGLAISSAIVAHNTTTLATVANNLLLNPFTPNKTITSSSLNINVTVLGTGVIARILIYSNLNGLPNTKLYESSDLSLATTGIKTATVSFTFTAGTTYWLALNTSGVATINCMPNTAVTPIFNSGISPVTMHRNPSVAVGSAPATYSYTSFQTTAVPLIWIIP